MKITKNRLKQIIKEELEAAVNEERETPSWWRFASPTGFYKSYEDLVAKGKFNVEKDVATDSGAGKQFKGYILSIFQDITDRQDPIPKTEPIVQKFLSADPMIKGIAYQIGNDARYSDDKEKKRTAMKAILAMLG
jgi:hypothetical protein